MTPPAKPLIPYPRKHSMKLTRFPRVRITHSPTPLEFMPRLTEALAGPNLYIKRDD